MGLYNPMKIAFMTGTGLAGFENILTNIVKHKDAYNKFGKIVVYYEGEYNGLQVVILPRHGTKEEFRTPTTLAKQNGYEANIYLLHELGVQAIFATSAVGAMDPGTSLVDKGSFVIPHTYIRWFASTQHSFGQLAKEEHPNTSNPFNQELRRKVIEIIRSIGLSAQDEGIYIYNGGDQFETSAEINFLNKMAEGKNRVIGMTTVPEAVLTLQMKIPFVVICCPTNYAEGVCGTKVEHQNHVDIMKPMQENMGKIFKAILDSYSQGNPSPEGISFHAPEY